jgi:CheY-like chemotaxis protein
MAKQVQESTKRVRALVVEDDQSSRDALSKLLERAGYEVMCAVSVGEAMKLLDWHPRKILLDLMLPDGNGVAVLERIRNERLPIKVAVITGASDPQLLDQVERLSPDARFYKPLDLQILLGWLGRDDSGIWPN